MEYTVVVEASNEDRTVWQALAPAEALTSTDRAEDVARWTASNQTLAEGGHWRVRVWEGSGRLAAEIYSDQL